MKTSLHEQRIVAANAISRRDEILVLLSIYPQSGGRNGKDVLMQLISSVSLKSHFIILTTTYGLNRGKPGPALVGGTVLLVNSDSNLTWDAINQTVDVLLGGVYPYNTQGPKGYRVTSAKNNATLEDDYDNAGTYLN